MATTAEEELDNRTEVAIAALGEMPLAWRVEHTNDCPGHVGGPCGCPMDVWFRAAQRLAKVGWGTDAEVYWLH